MNDGSQTPGLQDHNAEPSSARYRRDLVALGLGRVKNQVGVFSAANLDRNLHAGFAHGKIGMLRRFRIVGPLKMGVLPKVRTALCLYRVDDSPRNLKMSFAGR